MNRQQEKVLVAALCGIIIAGAGAFAVQPAMADQPMRPSGAIQINAQWPAAHSERIDLAAHHR